MNKYYREYLQIRENNGWGNNHQRKSYDSKIRIFSNSIMETTQMGRCVNYMNELIDEETKYDVLDSVNEWGGLIETKWRSGLYTDYSNQQSITHLEVKLILKYVMKHNVEGEEIGEFFERLYNELNRYLPNDTPIVCDTNYLKSNYKINKNTFLSKYDLTYIDLYPNSKKNHFIYLMGEVESKLKEIKKS